MALTVEFMFLYVAYRVTVYRTGLQGLHQSYSPSCENFEDFFKARNSNCGFTPAYTVH